MIAVSKKDATKTTSRKAANWATAPKGPAGQASEAARMLQTWMDGIENQSWARRWADYTFFRYMTGRPTGPASYSYSSTSRPASANVYSRAVFQTPRYNVLRQCASALAVRLFKSTRTFLQVNPIADGSFRDRVKAKGLTRWLDAAFYDLKLWPMIEKAGADSRMWGSGWLKVDVSPDKKSIKVTRVIKDEVVVDENETNASEWPKKLGIRVFMHREELEDAFGDIPGALEAIANAPKSNNGFYFGDLDCTDILVLRESWALPVGKRKGRHLLTIGNFALVDEEYTRDHYPLARLLFEDEGFYGMGMAEMVLGLQREVDRVLAANWENVRRAAWPRIGIAAGSNVNEAQLADTSNGIYHYTGTAPKFDFPKSIDPEMRAYLNETIQRIKDTFRLGDAMVTGQNPKLTSGTAIDKMEDAADGAHVNLSQYIEDFVEQIGVLLVEAAEICKPVVTLPGRRIQQIKWDDVQIARSSYSLRAFPVGRLSQSIAVKQQQIQTWLAAGRISQATAMRLEQVPDVDGYQDLANASQDYIAMVLDLAIDDGVYSPIEPWCDLEAALEQIQSRYLTEKTQKTPQDRLDLVLHLMSQTQELIDEANPAPAPGTGPAAAGFGIQPPAGPAPAPSPYPYAPDMAAPAPPPPQ